jgi:hypothetical protein
MNLIRVMPAKGSGLPEAKVSGHDDWPNAAFPHCGKAVFFFAFC